MVKYLLIFGMLYVTTLKAQDYTYLDSIPQEKRALLIKFKQFFAVETIGAAAISSFRKNFDAHQKNINAETYTLFDFKTKKNKLVPLKVINSLNKSDFSIYALSLYAKVLTYKDLAKLDSINNTEKGKALMAEIQQVFEGKIDPQEFPTIFSDNESYDFFSTIHAKLGFVFDNLFEALFKYIDMKAKIYALNKRN